MSPLKGSTELRDITGSYRNTLVSALDLYVKELKKLRKLEESVDGETAHIDVKDQIVEEIRYAIGAPAADAKGTPIGRAIREGEDKVRTAQQIDLEDLEAGIDLMDDSVISMMLELVDCAVPAEIIKSWNRDTRRDVYRWARAVQLFGTPGVSVKVPVRPAVIQSTWFAAEVRDQLALGDIDDSTLEPVELTDAEIENFLGIGPWSVKKIEIPVEGQGETTTTMYTLEFDDARLDDFSVNPNFTEKFADEKKARERGARLNRHLNTKLAEIGEQEAPQVQEVPLTPEEQEVADILNNALDALDWSAVVDDIHARDPELEGFEPGQTWHPPIDNMARFALAGPYVVVEGEGPNDWRIQRDMGEGHDEDWKPWPLGKIPAAYDDEFYALAVCALLNVNIDFGRRQAFGAIFPNGLFGESPVIDGVMEELKGGDDEQTDRPKKKRKRLEHKPATPKKPGDGKGKGGGKPKPKKKK